ncbi:MAG: sugar transferase [Clostridia bacterium]|nr:sugar transferase [Clostridia bacterium]
MEENQIAIPFDIEKVHENILLRLSRKARTLVANFIRRITEIIISLFGIIGLIPLSMVVFFQNLKNKDNGPIFYTQERIGKNGKLFKMYKFRTMVNNADEILEAMLKDKEIAKEYYTYRKLRNDPRLTKFGKVLRAKCLDEFPQFINVLKGEMAIVGPRPYLPEEQERMGDYYNYIVAHKPGITGVYQIAGNRRLEFNERLDLDLRYHYRRSMILDTKIALITLLVTLRKKETYQVGEMAWDTFEYVTRSIARFIKRIVDILGGIVGMIFLIPLSVGIWLGNRICGDKGPLFYSQDRIGQNGKIFKMYKFRSMVVGAEEKLKELLEKDEEAREEYSTYKKLKNDPRITKVGEFIRKTSLDEFPQFINVLKGELSLVGPRAYMVTEKPEMGDAYETIIQCKPGITGLWQVSGRSDVTFENRLDMDINYYENYSLGMDIKILFKTVSAVLNGDGAE